MNIVDNQHFHLAIAILTNLLVFRIIDVEKRCCQSVSPKGNLK